MRSPAVLISIVLATPLSSCIVTDGGLGPIPGERLDVSVVIEADETRILEFAVMVEAIREDIPFRILHDPTPQELAGMGLEVEHSIETSDDSPASWPDERIEVPQQETWSGVATLTLTNRGEHSVDVTIELGVQTLSAGLPGLVEEDVDIAVTMLP